jgi:predicted nucleotidyltransferase
MQTQSQTPTKHDAELARVLVEKFPAIDSVLLCGSVARGDANQWSDIDLMITTSNPKLTRAHLREAFGDRTNRVSLIFYRTADFEKEYKKRGLFVAHLIKEGIPLYDKLGLLRQVLSEPSQTPTYPRKSRTSAPSSHHTCTPSARQSSSSLWPGGILEFNRETAFRRFAIMSPDLAGQIGKVTRLRPYSLVSCRGPEPLPFSYHTAAAQMTEAVNAIDPLRSVPHVSRRHLAPPLFDSIKPYSRAIVCDKRSPTIRRLPSAITSISSSSRTGWATKSPATASSRKNPPFGFATKSQKRNQVVLLLIISFERYCYVRYDVFSETYCGESTEAIGIFLNYLQLLLERISAWSAAEKHAVIQQRSDSSLTDLKAALKPI